MKLTDYTTLGRSGLRVSPLCFGAMTFGTGWGFGSEEKESKAMFEKYVEAGGNFIDTADGYTNGESEQMVGKFTAEANLRDRLAIATKFTFNGQPGNPNAGGNGRKNIYRALDGSLRRLKMDYVDLYYLHAWDVVTPVEEVVSTLTDLIRAGKIRYYGFSDTPAWYVARAQTLAEQQGKEGMITLQLEYSLVERNIEREHVPVAQELGIGICPWSPLAGGFLAGKYKREGSDWKGSGRLETMRNAGHPLSPKFSGKHWAVLDVVNETAKLTGKSPAQVSLNWCATQPGVTSTIIGATSVRQLEDNLGSLDFEIPVEQRKKLNATSALEPIHPYVFFQSAIRSMISGGTSLGAWQPADTFGRTDAARPTAATPTKASAAVEK